MKTIVFLMGYYYPYASANVTCCINVINELKKKYRVIVICGSNTGEKKAIIDDVEVHYVYRDEFSDKYINAKSKIERKKMLFGRVLHNIIILPFFPYTELLFSRRMFRELTNVLKETNVDIVVGNFRPSAGLYPLEKLKKIKEYEQLKTIAYYLDMLHVAPKPAVVPKALYDKLCIMADKKIFKAVDRIILPKGGKEYYSKEVFLANRDKMIFLDFPVFIIKENNTRTNKDNIFVYTGTINSFDRDPEYLLKVLKYIESFDYFNYSVHFYGRVDNKEVIESYEDKYCERFYYHGIVSKEEADEKINEAKFIIVFGNKSFGSVPSKLFESIGTKKQIVYIASGEEDYSLEYLEKYPNSCVLYRDEDLDLAAKKMYEFIIQEPIELDDEQLKEDYFSASPKAVTNIIEDMI